MMGGPRTLEYIAGKAPRYEVVRGAVVVRVPGGEQKYIYRGGWLPVGVDQNVIDRLLTEGLIRAVGSAS